MCGIFASGHRCHRIATLVQTRDRREKYSKCGPRAKLRFDCNASTETLDDSMNHRKPQAGALPDGTGGKERFKYALDGRRVHSVSGIADPEFDARLPALVGWCP